MESIKSEKFQKLSNSELKNVHGGSIAWGKANTKTVSNGGTILDYRDKHNDIHTHGIGNLWF